MSKFVKQHWQILLIVIVAAFLRTWNLSSHGILFGDAAHDLLTARRAVETNTLPLLGISSSIPRFHQGPLTIWLEMVIYTLAGPNTLVFSTVFALIGLAAVIGCYEFATVYINREVGVLAAALIALSPLAIAHSRVPYHTTPIPLAIIFFLFSLLNLWHHPQNNLAVFIAALSWILVLQFELSVVALGLVIPYIWWRQKISWRPISQTVRRLASALSGVIVGLLPQLVHDLTSPIAQNQVGGYLIWIIYRLIKPTGILRLLGIEPSAALPKATAVEVTTSEITTSPMWDQLTHHLSTTLLSFGKYLPRMVAIDSVVVTAIFAGIGLYTVIAIYRLWQSRELPVAVELTVVSLLLLTGSYFFYGSPSEAYFPPYFPLLAILLGWGVHRLLNSQYINHYRQLGITVLTLWGIFSIYTIFTHNFFVSTSQQTSFNYGASTNELRQIVKLLTDTVPDPIYLTTTSEAGKFESYLDNFRWIAIELKASEKFSPTGIPVYIDNVDSSLASYPRITKLTFPSYDIYIR